LNDYYAVRLKGARLARLTLQARFRLAKGALQDRDAVERAFAEFAFVN
jgi:UDP-glucuronate 4-epimerase